MCVMYAAVEAAVRVLEDDPAFDAGVGSVLTEEGEVEMDAIIVDGKSLEFGAVACVNNIQNAVSLARRVMEDTQVQLQQSWPFASRAVCILCCPAGAAV